MRAIPIRTAGAGLLGLVAAVANSRCLAPQSAERGTGKWQMADAPVGIRAVAASSVPAQVASAALATPSERSGPAALPSSSAPTQEASHSPADGEGSVATGIAQAPAVPKPMDATQLCLFRGRYAGTGARVEVDFDGAILCPARVGQRVWMVGSKVGFVETSAIKGVRNHSKTPWYCGRSSQSFHVDLSRPFEPQFQVFAAVGPAPASQPATRVRLYTSHDARPTLPELGPSKRFEFGTDLNGDDIPDLVITVQDGSCQGMPIDDPFGLPPYVGERVGPYCAEHWARDLKGKLSVTRRASYYMCIAGGDG